jgi:hypothetical protein
MNDLRTIETGPPIEESALEKLEAELGVELPGAYRTFLKRSSGGRPERDVFPIHDFPGNPEGRIHFFFSIDHPFECYRLGWNRDVFSDRIPPELLPIATTEGEDQVCLGISGEARGRVIYWYGVEYDDRAERFYPIADSFEQFLNELHRDEYSPEIES